MHLHNFMKHIKMTESTDSNRVKQTISSIKKGMLKYVHVFGHLVDARVADAMH